VATKFELHRHHKFFLGFAGLIFAGAGAGAWFTWKSCQELDEQATNLNDQVTAAKSRIATIDDLEKEVIVLRENVQNYVRILPSDSEVNDFFRKIEDFRRDSGVEISELRSQPNRTKVASSAVFDRAEYKIQFYATYAQFLQFINRLENYERFVSISSLRIQAGMPPEKDKSQTSEIKHKYDVTVVTYVYTGEDVGKGVTIPGYDRKREQLAEQITEMRNGLALEKFNLVSETSRRDPFVDPRPRRNAKGSANQPAVEEQRALLNRVIARIQECNGLLDLLDTSDSVLQGMERKVQALNILSEISTQVEEANSKGQIADANLKKDWEKKVMPELAKLKTRLGDSTQPVEQDRLRYRQTLARMEATYESGAYEDCVKAFDTIRVLSSVPSADPELVQVQQRMEQLWTAAQTAVEFKKKKIVVNGLVVYPGQESVAIVNKTVYRAGETIEDDLVLLEIHEDHLVFEFKGVPLNYDL
jgi:Tfp pilus assembly protein PilO